MPTTITPEFIIQQRGRYQGACHIFLRVLTIRFGEIPETLKIQVQMLRIDQIMDLLESALTQNSLDEFVQQWPNIIGIPYKPPEKQ